jgi:hypothetical protein
MPQFRRAVYGPFLKAVWGEGVFYPSDIDRNLAEIDYDGMVKLGETIDGVLSLFERTERIILERAYGLIDGRKDTKTNIGRQLGLTADQVSNREIKSLSKVRRYDRGGHSLNPYRFHRSLFSRYPEMLEEWKGVRQDRGKDIGARVKVNSNRKMNWRCRTDPQHEWQATPRERTRKNTPKHCPDCEKKRTKRG